MEGSWRPDNPNAKFPRLGIEARDNGGKFSSWWVKDGTYLRLKSVQLGYTLPKKLTEKAGFRTIRAYVSGGNLLTICGLDYMDPEMPGVNQGYYPQQRTYQVSLFWDKEKKSALLCDTTLKISSSKSDVVKIMIPMKDKVGKHKVILKVSDGKRVYRKTKEIEVIQSDIRSIQQISGAWTGIYHWSEEEGKHWNQDIKKMTDDHWREMIRSMHKIEMDMVVIQEVFRHQAYIGSSTTVEDYPGKAFYPSKLYPGRMDIAAEDPIEAILSEADKQGMQVLMGVGMFAWFDFTPESLEWHKRVAKELWDMYGHHESFYAF